MIVGDIIERNALHDRTGRSLVFGDRTITHGEFLDRACRLANALIDMGVGPQDRVAVLSQNSAQLVEAYAAAELCGFILVPLNYRLTEAEVAGIIDDCEASVLLYQGRFEGIVKGVLKIRPLRCGAIRVDGDGNSYETLLQGSSGERPGLRPAPEDIAYLVYTSGTTGRPKGVMISHRAILEGARGHVLEFGIRPTDTALIVMPLYHVGAKITQVNLALLGGATCILPAFDIEQVLATIERERVTTALFAPVMVQRILDHPTVGDYDLSSLRLLQLGSAPMPVPLLKRALSAFKTEFAQSYGMTEALLCSALLPHQHHPEGSEVDVGRLASAGQPLFGGDIRIVDADQRECAPGEVGDIQISGPSLMSGYWNNPSLTAEVLRDGWLDSGDKGYFDEDHYLFIVDRKKDMVVSGGENIYSREVEEALLTHPAVAEAAVIAVPHPQWGEAVKACVVLRSGRTAEPDELIDHCRSRLASYKKPQSIDFLAELPRLHNGKIDKKALRAPHWHGATRQIA